MKEENKIETALRFLFEEKKIIEKIKRRFKIREELIIPMLFSIKYGGSWSYVNEECSIAVKDRTTIFDGNVGFTKEKIYLFINPEVVESRGIVYRLEKCGSKKERVLVKRAYEVHVKADKIIVAEINPKTKTILIREEKLNNILLKPPLSYSFMHEYEHVMKREIEGEDIFGFSIIYGG